MSILVVRLGAMGDIVHALPAVASLKMSFSGEELIWLVKSRWIDLLEGNPYVDQLLSAGPGESGLKFWKRLRNLRPRVAIDFQGLLQSALLARSAGPQVLWGFDKAVAREPFAARFYTHAEHVTGPHRIERNLQLVRAAGAVRTTHDVWLPPGRQEGELPVSPFVLASPFAGWTGKQWPLDNYAQLAVLLGREGLPLVMNVSADLAPSLRKLPNVYVHLSSVAGLIYATRQAAAVIGVDSGPLHIAAGLGKHGVAIFGPTDPLATGPYGESMLVLRTPGVDTTYDRHSKIHTSMRAIEPREVFSALMKTIETRSSPMAGRSA